MSEGIYIKQNTAQIDDHKIKGGGPRSKQKQKQKQKRLSNKLCKIFVTDEGV